MIFTHSPEVYNTKAAKVVVPILIDFFKPNSIIDVGCGLGTWLKVFSEFGLDDITGIDGNYVNTTLLEIPIYKFISADLEKSININKKYDLLICLEVAEHLSSSRAEDFIKDLTNLSDVIVFSAAIPNQEGQGHINEQYPNYWIKIFNTCNYEVFDTIRPKIWNENEVDWWYRQNILVFKRNNSTLLNSQKNINPIISAELFEIKVNEISSLKNEIIKIDSGDKSLKFYLKVLIRKLRKRYL